ncbi:MAG: hypothetical protein K2Z81_19310, partial [Cyanobacteria bacterium]|nr:hypothetical protein [Cyanobacteriota bacterium]
MFDYQAGEKYKLTLIMVGMAGVMVGMFFTLLFMGDSQPQQVAHKPRPKWADHPDVTGQGSVNEGPRATGMPGGNPEGAPPAPPQQYEATDPTMAMQLIEQWLPVAWDLSAGSAADSQSKAIKYMTSDCASAYQQNVWTPEIAAQIEQSGLRSSFKAHALKIGATKPDGAVVIMVEGEQLLEVPGKG